MTEERRPRTAPQLVIALRVLICLYLYFVGFYLGSRGEPSIAQAIANDPPPLGNVVLMFVAAPFMVFPALLGVGNLIAQTPQSIIGTILAIIVFGATYAVLSARGLGRWWLPLFALYAYALGFAVEFVLTAYLAVELPPISR